MRKKKSKTTFLPVQDGFWEGDVETVAIVRRGIGRSMQRRAIPLNQLKEHDTCDIVGFVLREKPTIYKAYCHEQFPTLRERETGIPEGSLDYFSTRLEVLRRRERILQTAKKMVALGCCREAALRLGVAQEKGWHK